MRTNRLGLPAARTEAMTIRLSREERDLLNNAAAISGKNLTEFSREMALQAAASRLNAA